MKAEELVGKVVVDVRRRMASRVVKLHGKGEYISPANGEPVAVRVLELESGDTSVVLDGEREEESLAGWLVLDEKGEQFYVDVAKAVQEMTRAICGAAAGLGVPAPAAFSILGTAYRSQSAALLKDPS